MKRFIFILFLPFLFTTAHAQLITTIVGNGVAGFMGDNGPALNCELHDPFDVELDDSGNVYIADEGNGCVRKVDRNGIITTVAGMGGNGGYSGDHGPAIWAQMGAVTAIAIDRRHNLYIADPGYNCIRKVDTAGIITTFAGTGVPGFSGDSSAATAAQLKAPLGVAADKAGNVYICDQLNHRIRRVDTAGIITTIAGTGVAGFGGDHGPATAALISDPAMITTDTFDNIYFSEGGGKNKKDQYIGHHHHYCR